MGLQYQRSPVDGIAAELRSWILLEVHEVADEEIQASVVVVIKPYGAGGPAGSGDAGFRGDVGESAVAVIVIKNAAGILRDVKVGESVAIVISDCDAHAVGVAGHAGFFGDVGKSAVAIVAIERVTQWLRQARKNRSGRC